MLFSAAAGLSVIVAVAIAAISGIDTATAPVIRVVLFGLAPAFAVLTAAAIAVVLGRGAVEVAPPTLLALAAVAFSTAAQSAGDAAMIAEEPAPSAGWWFVMAAGVIAAALSILSVVRISVRAERENPGVRIAFAACSLVGGVVIVAALAIWVTSVALAIAALVAVVISQRSSRRALPTARG